MHAAKILERWDSVPLRPKAKEYTFEKIE